MVVKRVGIPIVGQASLVARHKHRHGGAKGGGGSLKLLAVPMVTLPNPYQFLVHSISGSDLELSMAAVLYHSVPPVNKSLHSLYH